MADPRAEGPKPVALLAASSGYVGLHVQDMTIEMADVLGMAGQQDLWVSETPQPSPTGLRT
ncbi:hypothetical protein [Antarctobacter heliothermus]|uniref:hypothetical protein n=1 Tax=Antarctobacter heliothermus TaxID=74033 RepID=UPI000B8BCAE5|nr:hypothetical protein [Antarctobacter heliothermus]